MSHLLNFLLSLSIYFGVHSDYFLAEKLNQKVNDGRIFFVEISPNITESLDHGSLELKNVQNRPCQLLRGLHGTRNRMQ